MEASSAISTLVNVFPSDLSSQFHLEEIRLIDESDIDGGIHCDLSAELE